MASRALLLSTDGAASGELRKALESGGLEVTVADDVEAAAMQLGEHAIVVLAATESRDLADLCRQVVASAASGHPPIVAVSDSSDVESRVQLLEAGADDVLARPIIQRELEAIVDALLLRAPDSTAADAGSLTRPRVERRTAPGKVIVFAAAKGGSGATSLAVNTALALADSSREAVCIADLDMYHGQVTTYLDVRPRSTTVEMAADDLIGQSPETIAEAGGLHSSGLMVFGAPYRSDDAVDVTPDRISGLIEMLRGVYGHVVIDTGSVIDQRTLTAMGKADRLAIVITPDVPALRLLHAGLQLMSESGSAIERAIFVVNNVYPKHSIEPEQIESHLSIKIGLEIPYDGENFLQAANVGKPVLLSAPRSPAAQAIRRLGVMLSDGAAAPEVEEPPRREKRGGLLGGLIGRN
jgi:pilus assembly protein CpaE